jgi:hypothetical protein
MLKTLKAIIFISLMVGLSWWVVAIVTQQGVLGASNKSLVNQVKQNTPNKIRLSHQADHGIDNANPPLNSTIVMSSCTPSPPGESNNVFDALTICSGQTVSGQVNDNDSDDVYKIWTVANQQLTISINGTGVGGPGDADLYLYPPGTIDVNTDPYEAASENIGNNELIQGTVLEGGFWYIDVFDCCDSDGGTNYNLTVTLSGIGVTGTSTFDLTGSGRIRDHSRSKAPD